MELEEPAWLPVGTAPLGGPALYKLVRVGADGRVHAASEEEAASIEAGLGGGASAAAAGTPPPPEERSSLLERMDALNRMLGRVAADKPGAAAPVPTDDGAPVAWCGDAVDNPVTGADHASETKDHAAGGSLLLPHEGEEGPLLGFDGDLLEGGFLGHGQGGMMWGDTSLELGGEERLDDELVLPAAPPPGASPRAPNAAGGGPAPGGGAKASDGRAGRQAGGAHSGCTASGQWVAPESLGENSSLAFLRACYKKAYGRETTSNNRQWLLRRLLVLPSSASGGSGEPSPGGSPHHAHSAPVQQHEHSDDGVNDAFSEGDASLHAHGDSAGRAHKAAGHNRFLGPGGMRLPVAAGSGAALSPVQLPGQAPRAEGKRAVKPNRQFMDTVGLDSFGLEANGSSDALNTLHRTAKGKLPRAHPGDGAPASALSEQRLLGLLPRQGSVVSPIGAGKGHHHGFGGKADSMSVTGIHVPGMKRQRDMDLEWLPDGDFAGGVAHAAGEYFGGGGGAGGKVRKKGRAGLDEDEDHVDKRLAGSRKGSSSRKHADGTNGTNGRRSKHHNPWALEEAEALVEGVARCGGGKWADIKKLGFPAIEHRTAVDLKDKWRNLLRIAMLPTPQTKVTDKKREIPQALLSRVRELAAQQPKVRPQSDAAPPPAAATTLSSRGRAPKPASARA